MELRNLLSCSTELAGSLESPGFQNRGLGTMRLLQGWDSKKPPGPLLALLFGLAQAVYTAPPASKPSKPQKAPKPPPRASGPPQTTADLRRAAFNADVDAIAEILSASADIIKLGDGLKFNPPGAEVSW